MAWKGLRDQHLGIDLASALAALEEVMPPEVRATFRPPLTPEQAEERPGSDDTVTTWHDGQLPGTGAVWGLGASFRFMSSEEIEAMDEQIEAKQQDWPRWPQNERWDQYLTDDAGGYVIAVEFDRFVLRMPGVDEDIPTASSPSAGTTRARRGVRWSPSSPSSRASAPGRRTPRIRERRRRRPPVGMRRRRSCRAR
jgi:hypothetical protein